AAHSFDLVPSRSVTRFPSLVDGESSGPSAIQHVREAPAEPDFACGVVVMRINGLVEDVRIAAAQPRDFLFEPGTHLRHQLGLAISPHVVAMSKPAQDAWARGLDHVLI